MAEESRRTSHSIGELNEQPLHAALKEWYARPGDGLEVSVDGFVIDVVQDGLLVEIQTGNFTSIKQKLRTLTENHPVRLVYPIAREKWLLKLEKERRKSPKRGRVEEVFDELVSFPELLARPSFSLEVLLIQEEEVRRYVGQQRWWQRGWKTVERRLIKVLERRLFERADDLRRLLPPGLSQLFTTTDLAEAMDGSRRLAQKMAYCLRKTGVIEQVGVRGRSHLYSQLPSA